MAELMAVPRYCSWLQLRCGHSLACPDNYASWLLLMHPYEKQEQYARWCSLCQAHCLPAGAYGRD